MDSEIKSLGFTKEDIEVICKRLTCRLDLEDWESMELFENDEALFKYMFIEDETKESLTASLLDMAKIPIKDLKNSKSLMEYMIADDGYSILKLPSGRWVTFSENLLWKDKYEDMYEEID
ncbi:hypothetical protein P4606_21635 [Priestia aryabhattai]|uniref:hypothetical protein n=1 Tax=Priestia aryabhattai TaxID=412384 RepID=UPI002E1EFF63|nr:hypothetical protein [Priestia aryabhattai]